MNPLEIIKRQAAYASGYKNIPTEAQNHAKQLCWEYNHTAPSEQDKRHAILQELLGECSPMTNIEPDFHCDYGFNIYTQGLVVINYNCVRYISGSHWSGCFYSSGSMSGLFWACY